MDGTMNRWGKGNGRLKGYLFVLLIALELLVSFTFLGYIHVPPITITFAYIPVLMAGCTLGVAQSTALGCVFGLSSMYKASAYYVLPFDQAFSPFLSASPVNSVILSVGVRTLFGFLIGLFFAFARKSRHNRIWTILVAAIAPKLHSTLVYGALGILFPELGYSLQNALSLDIDNVAASVVCMAMAWFIWKAGHTQAVRDFSEYIQQPRNRINRNRRGHLFGALFMGCILGAAVASTLYFANRISYMLSVHGMDITANIEYDLLHLQIQFMIAIIALNFILGITLLLLYQYFSYRAYLGQMDSMTGVMGRKMFLAACERLQRSSDAGWFIFVDVDRFKSINDTLGHPVGDTVLKEIAGRLKGAFSEDGIVGRMGGDEFAVMLEKMMPLPELKEKMDGFLKNISGILPSPETVSCSIGACRFNYPQQIDTLYSQTDKILYVAKRQGRACYVVGKYNGTDVELLD